MISRVIEARPDDLRAFLEEAAGISRYKERRRETENRIGQTRENLDRLNDLREEVEKQIRHLQRQAATARRYQTLKEEERKLQAELLALRLQSLDAEAGCAIRPRNNVTPPCTQCSRTCAKRRPRSSRFASINRPRLRRSGPSKQRFYGAGSEVTRIEQSIQHARELRQRQATDLDQSQVQVQELTGVIQRDRARLEALSAELATMIPRLDAAHGEESSASELLVRCEHALAAWQHTWDEHSQSVARGQRETQVERARIEQLENQQHRLLQQQERQETERLALAQQQPAVSLDTLAEQAAASRDAGQKAATDLSELLAELAVTRDREREQTQALNALRSANGSRLGYAGIHRSPAAGGARQSIRQGDAVAEGAVARP
jgi:chromosome segregation protein